MSTLDLSTVIEHFANAFFDVALPAVFAAFVLTLRNGWDRIIADRRARRRSEEELP